MRGTEVIKWKLYADDVALFCKSVNEAKQILNIINDTCNRFGLTISFKKTKTQVFNNAELAKEASLFNIQGNEIENVQTFTYLGHVISSNEVNCFTENRIVSATNKFNEMRSVLTDTNVYMRTKRKILEACVRSRLTYATQAVLPNEKQLKKLEACWYRLLRSMVKGKWVGEQSQEESDEETTASYIPTRKSRKLYKQCQSETTYSHNI